MNDSRIHLIDTVLDAINQCKKTAFSRENIELDYYLGGDLGIDSREMLEIWYDIEKTLGVHVHDYEKRDIYTLDDVVSRFEKVFAEQSSVA